MIKRYGEQTVLFSKPVGIMAAASVVGHKEGEGPLGRCFDIVQQDLTFGTKSWEKAESEFVKEAVKLCASKAQIKIGDFEYIIGGDLLNQSTGSVFGLLSADRPYVGIFGACSAIGKGMALGGMMIDGGFAQRILVAASSHFCSVEKQFRFPLEFGSQRPPTSGWTVTGAGAVALSSNVSLVNDTPKNGPSLTGCTIGKMVCKGITDQNNMAAAMAPAAAHTIVTHLKDLGRPPDYYDAIITGDLGHVGSDLLLQLTAKEGCDISNNHKDCGIEIFDQKTQDTHNGGSGCACSAVVFASHFYEQMKQGKLNKIFFVPTGALLSVLSVQQGETIPGIAHGVIIEN
jgi:stage V sporulation protein AD